MDLSAWNGGNLGPSHHKIAEATRLDALRGLADICDAAAAQSADSRTTSSIILHLLRSAGPGILAAAGSQNDLFMYLLLYLLAIPIMAITSRVCDAACRVQTKYNEKLGADYRRTELRSILRAGAHSSQRLAASAGFSLVRTPPAPLTQRWSKNAFAQPLELYCWVAPKQCWRPAWNHSDLGRASFLRPPGKK